MRTTIDDTVLGRPVAGHNLGAASTVGDVIDGATPTVVVFLRHYG